MDTVDPSRIQRAAAARKRQLRLTNQEICRRTGLAPRTVTALLRDKVNEETMRRASRALDWPEDALWRVGLGEDPDGITDLPWVDEDAEAVERRLRRVENYTAEIDDRTGRIEEALEQVLELLRTRGGPVENHR